MPLQTTLSELVVNAQADVFAAFCDEGYIDVLTGPKPELADEEINKGQIVLVTMRFGKPAFLRSAGGIIVANPIDSGEAVADGDPRWFRAYRADHRTALFDGSAGKGADFNMALRVKTIIQGVIVGCSGLTHAVRKSMPGI